METVRDSITKIVEKWYILEPVYFSVWSLHTVIPSAHVNTIRCGGGKVEYNPDFLKALTREQLYEVLCFEAMRIVLKHPYTRKKEIDSLSYMASNITLQEYLKADLGFPFARDVFATNDYDAKYFEFYYDILIERMQAGGEPLPHAMGAQSPGWAGGMSDDRESGGAGGGTDKHSGPGNQGTGESQISNNAGMRGQSQYGSSKTSDGEEASPPGGQTAGGEDVSPPDGQASGGTETPRQAPSAAALDDYASMAAGMENCENWGKSDYYGNLINEQIIEIEAGDNWGSLGGYLKKRILATLKPKVDYRSILRSFRASVLSVSRRLTRMKPSRRYGFQYMGSKRDFATRLLFAVDVSGSIGRKDLEKGFSIVNRFFKYGIEQLDVITFDTEIKGECLSLKRARKEIAVLGRGGTNFQPVLDYIDRHIEYDGLIIFTDGYAPVPY
ncbi:MAG: hypothetical protein GY765_05215, partial [bacterium]|nr:hypothetical protein [bacterium]